MTDVSPKLNSPDHPHGRSEKNVERILEAAAALREAVDSLASAMVSGSGIDRAEARDRFEIALSMFSERIDQTAD